MLDRDFCLFSFYFPPREKLYQENSKDWPKLLPKVAKLCDTLMVFLKEYFQKSCRQQKSMKNFPGCKELQRGSTKEACLKKGISYWLQANFVSSYSLHAGLFCMLLHRLPFCSKLTYSGNTFRVSNSLDPDQAQHFVRPDLGPNCLQRLSAELSHY